MPKDPRFNFYTDNWIGGTEGFTLEQEGAYLALIIMQSKVGRFTQNQALDKLLQKTRGNTAVSTGLWNFLIQKFETDGALFWSTRLETEMSKSKVHSEKQSERVKKRWHKESGNTVVLPVNRTGSGIGSGEEILKDYDTWTEKILEGNDQFFEQMSMKENVPRGQQFKNLVIDHRDLLNRYPKMRPPDQNAFRRSCIKHIKENLNNVKNGTRTTDKTTVRRADATIEGGREFGSL